jgi:hypothetical protein
LRGSGITRTIKYGHGFTYPKKGYNRSYRITVVYKDQLCENPYTGYVYERFAPFETIGAGDFSHQLTGGAPSWNDTCGYEENGGHYSRRLAGSSAGRNYSYSLSVKAGPYIGFGMSISRPYTTSANMEYFIGATGNHYICGKDDTPLRASKVREVLQSSAPS